ncbi:5566_t:CDS:2 [Ambispora gerdemannii]|uniref:ATP synthase subunit 4 n=1 Tax=Ambispora gerdemannii TaxID=144530 RepID=A0A9N8VYD1_9GLOM|nr:5566_t:CDS:2 [Ambispora gerdemannii]
MALSLLRNRSAIALARRPALVTVQRIAFAPGNYVTPAKGEKPVNPKEVDPKEKARSIIDSLPGNSLISKTGYFTVGAGLLTYAISKEIYVLNEETLVVIAFIGLCSAIVKYGKEPLVEYFAERGNRINKLLQNAREAHKVAVKDRIDSVSQLGDIVEVTKGLFALSKETAKLEAEAFELKQKVEVTAEIKSVLDSWVRYETAVRAREQRALANAVIEKVKQSLQDNKTQQQILNESLAEIESKARWQDLSISEL